MNESQRRDDEYCYLSPEQARQHPDLPSTPRSLGLLLAVWIVVGTLLGFLGAWIFA